LTRVFSFLNPADNLSHRVTPKRSRAKESSPVPEQSPGRYPKLQMSSSAKGPTVTNPPAFRYESSTSGHAPYSQASFQDSNTGPLSNYQNHLNAIVLSMDYVQNPNYAANDNDEAANTYHQQTFQPQAYNSNPAVQLSAANTYHQQNNQGQAHTCYPARQPATTDSFYAYESYTNSLTMSEHPIADEAPADEYQEHSPQLQTWADDTSDTNMPVNERLVKSNWE